jgi:hypothetical protein
MSNEVRQAHPAEPVAWILREQLDRGDTTARGYLWFTDPQNTSWVPLYAAPPVQPGWTLAPDFRGYARMGIGAYLLNCSNVGEPAELIISLATEEEKAGRVVGDLRENPPDAKPIQPEAMAVRLRFENVAGLDALEQQLRLLRAEHFPAAAPPVQPAPALTDEQIDAAMIEAGIGGYGEDTGTYQIPVRAMRQRLHRFAEALAAVQPAPVPPSSSQKLREAGFTRRPTGKTVGGLMKDPEDLAASPVEATAAREADSRSLLIARIDSMLSTPSGVPQDSARIVGAAAKDASEASEQDEREAFEAWCLSRNVNVAVLSSSAYPPGTYADSRTDAGWKAWQERARVQTQGERK